MNQTQKVVQYCLYAFVAGLLVGEVVLRFYFSLTGMDIKTFDAWFDLYRGHPFIGYVLNPGFQLKHRRGRYSPLTKAFSDPLEIKVNSIGFRGNEFSPKKEDGVYRIFCLGGSSTWGFGLNDNETWPYLFEQKLRQFFNGRPIEVINAGVPGYTTFHSLSHFHSKILDYDPDMIIVYHSWNDLKYIPYVSTEREFASMELAGDYDPPNWITQALHRSYLYVFLGVGGRYLSGKLFQAGRVDQESYAKREKQSSDLSHGFRVFKRNLLHMIAIAEADRVEVILANPLTLIRKDNTPEEMAKISYSYIGISPAQVTQAVEQMDSIFTELSQERNVRYVNLNRSIHPDLEMMIDHTHPTPKGAEHIADVFFQELKEVVASRWSGEIKESYISEALAVQR